MNVPLRYFTLVSNVKVEIDSLNINASKFLNDISTDVELEKGTINVYHMSDQFIDICEDYKNYFSHKPVTIEDVRVGEMLFTRKISVQLANSLLRDKQVLTFTFSDHKNLNLFKMKYPSEYDTLRSRTEHIIYLQHNGVFNVSHMEKVNDGIRWG